MAFLPTILYFLITIGILVLVHELGHFLAAKFFGMRVERFSIGFPPRAFGKKIGDTDYCISWIPIGGYVKISGMVDESLDTDFLGEDPKPWEFRAKPIWQRLIVICAGVAMNVLLAVLIFWGIIFYQGKTVKPVTEVGYVAPESPAAKAGFQIGDVVQSVNRKPVTYWEDVDKFVYTDALSGGLQIDVLRHGQPLTVSVPQALAVEILEERFGLYPDGLAVYVQTIEGGKPAERAGLLPGDIILAINDVALSYHALQETIKRYAGKEVGLTWSRGEETMHARISPTEEGKIGIGFIPVYSGPVEKVRYSILAALPEGIKDAWVMSWLNVKSIYQIVVGNVSFSKSVAGPITIAKLATRSAEVGVISFLGFMALLSMNLAILNLLPFPALDGGHAIFLVYEGVFRREIPNRVKIALQQVGFVLLLVFMAFVLYNDLVRF
ncbi:MAG: RIP metalloprotease RseP [Ignavibacteria bacterium]|nr:RIP metalloprotease RseP [Ignavibacteria bacterium]